MVCRLFTIRIHCPVRSKIKKSGLSRPSFLFCFFCHVYTNYIELWYTIVVNCNKDWCFLEKKYLKTSEYASLMDMSQRTVIRLFHEGKLKGYQNADTKTIRVLNPNYGNNMTFVGMQDFVFNKVTYPLPNYDNFYPTNTIRHLFFDQFYLTYNF